MAGKARTKRKKMERVIMGLTPQQVKDLDAAASKAGISRSEMLRRILDEALKQTK